MEREVANLERRVAELEAALAIVSRKTDPASPRRWVAPVPLMCAGVVVHLYDNTGNEQVTVGSPPPGSGRPHIQVLSSDGSAKVGIGINAAEGHGVIAFKGGKAQTSLWLTGQGLLQALNAQDKRVASLGVSGFGGGDLHLYNSSGTAVVGLFSEQGQTGILQLFNAAGQERVTLGTRTTGKGDVCASGDNGQLCLGRLNPKY